MKSIIALILLSSTAFAQSDLEIAIAIAKAKAKAQLTPVTTDAPQINPALLNPKAEVPVPADGQLSPRGEWRWSTAAFAWQPRQWRTEPQYGTERRVVGKRCNNGVCTPVYGEVRVRLPDRRVEVFPEEPAANLPADQQPTPMDGVDAGLKALKPKPGEVFVEFGAGHDARWSITAARDYGTQWAIGVEIDPAVAESARRYVDHAELSNRIAIVTGDATAMDFKAADIGVAYLWPETLAKLKPQIQKLDRFVSFGHAVPGLPMRQSGDLFIYERPQPVVMQQPQRPAGAVWNGRVYSGPVCNRRNCTMCASIRNQLAVR